MNGYAIAAAALLAAWSAGCGKDVSGDTWLVAAGGDTATVAEVGAAWDALDDEGREVFTSKDNPLGDFLLAFSRKMMIEMEIDARGYLADPELVARADARFRYEAGSLAVETLTAGERAGVSEEDVHAFLDRAGTWVWYTIRPGTEDQEVRGPEHLPEILPPELLAHLDTLAAGTTLPDASGIPVRLDSVLCQDSASLAETMADPARVREIAIESLALARAADRMREIADGMRAGCAVRIDTAAVERVAAFYRGEAGPVEETVLTSDLRNWTSGELRAEIAFLSTRTYVQPDSPEWLLSCLDDVLTRMALVDLQGLPAGAEDSLRRVSGAWILDLAAERLYDEEVSAHVAMTEADVLYQFENLTEPVELPERRVLRIARLPVDMTDAYREALADGTLDAFLGGLGGIPFLAATDDDPQRTRPLSATEIPPDWAGLVPGDTSAADSGWSAPLGLQGSEDYFLVRVEEVLPAGNAALEDIRGQVEAAARGRLEEEATIRWMQQLEEKYGLDVNEQALDRLPADPGLWSGL